MSITVEELRALAGHGRVVTDSGERVGPIGEIYVDDATGTPDWVTVRTGLFGTAETFVPLDTARVDGHDLVVPHAKDVIKDAPRIEVDGALSPQEEQVLYRHYRVGARAGRTPEPGAPGQHLDDTSPATDAVMTRSEERLVVGTQQGESGRARLRKHVVTETVTQTVPVRHEEVRLTREPIGSGEARAAAPGSVFDEEDYEVVLHAETLVVEKTVVPVERVRLDTVTVTAQETISADVRQERIELDDPTRPTSEKARPSGAAAGGPDAAKAPAGTPRSTPKGKRGTRRRH